MTDASASFLRPMLCALSPRENAARLGALRFALGRATEVACSWLPSTPATAHKVLLGKAIWHLCQAADAVGTRMIELQAMSEVFRSAPPLYAGFTNALLGVDGGEQRLRLLLAVAVPDVVRAAAEHAAATRSLGDGLTEWSMRSAVMRLEGLLEEAGEMASPAGLERLRGAPGVEEALAAFAASGGVLREPTSEAKIIGQGVELDRCAVPRTPAREAGLEVHDPAGPPPSSFAMFVHATVFNIEICAAEVCAVTVVEHPEAPWGLKLDMCRQIYDEVRHAESLTARLAEMGHALGDFPIDLRVWRSFRLAESLAEKLMIQQRIGEGAGLDGGAVVVDGRRQAGDARTALLFEYINSDEINHVRHGNRWIRQLVGGDGAAIAALEARAQAKIAAIGCARPPLPPWPEGRRMAGFTQTEVAARVAGWRAQSGAAPRGPR